MTILEGHDEHKPCDEEERSAEYGCALRSAGRGGAGSRGRSATGGSTASGGTGRGGGGEGGGDDGGGGGDGGRGRAFFNLDVRSLQDLHE